MIPSFWFVWDYLLLHKEFCLFNLFWVNNLHCLVVRFVIISVLRVFIFSLVPTFLFYYSDFVLKLYLSNVSSTISWKCLYSSLSLMFLWIFLGVAYFYKFAKLIFSNFCLLTLPFKSWSVISLCEFGIVSVWSLQLSFIIIGTASFSVYISRIVIIFLFEYFVLINILVFMILFCFHLLLFYMQVLTS